MRVIAGNSEESCKILRVGDPGETPPWPGAMILLLLSATFERLLHLTQGQMIVSYVVAESIAVDRVWIPFWHL